MNFGNLNGVLSRLDDKKPLTEEEHRALYQWLTDVGDQNRRMLDLEMTRRSLHAIRQFDESSRKLTRWLIRLTFILVILTIVIAGFTILLWKRG
ncbi:MAG: hypothetical protein ACYDD2_05415 [Candidatus Acidiferrales bacterium]